MPNKRVRDAEEAELILRLLNVVADLLTAHECPCPACLAARVVIADVVTQE
jgi:hypothetical protein